MTDIMKLAAQWGDARIMATRDRATNDEVLQARDALQSAIEALQAENEQFRLLAKANSEALGAALVERDALQAKLDAMGKGEPVIDFTVLHQFASDQAISYNKLCTAVRMCLAAPKALAPLTDERIDELAVTALTDYREGRNNDHERAFARAIEAAHGIGGTP